jgi:hypothetical protein
MVRSQVSIGEENRLFGEDDALNLEASQVAHDTAGVGTNENANPAVGQAYAIVRQEDAADLQSPFHAATVVARDGEFAITMEVFAPPPPSSPEAEIEGGVDRDTTPIFGLYQVGSAENSFHGHWTERYFGGNPITIVLDPYNGPQP